MNWQYKTAGQFMSRRFITGLAITSLLTACNSVAPVRDSDDIRIGSLAPAKLSPAPKRDIKNSRQAAMHHYQIYLSGNTDNILTPESLRRLADLHLAQEQQAMLDGTLAIESTPPRSSVLYQQLLSAYPDYPSRDSALYQLARSYEQAGDLEQAMLTLSRFATEFSDSDKIEEVQFRRGEHLFVLQDYVSAEQAYEAVVNAGNESPYYHQALYKLGWSRFKQSHYQSALDAYMQLLDRTIADHDNATPPAALAQVNQERLADTLRAVSLSFAYLGDSTKVAAYFNRIGSRKYEPLVYANLAGLYLSKERYSDAAETFSRFTVTHPDHQDTPMFQASVIDVYKQAGFNTRLLEEKQIYVERFEPGSSYWSSRTADDKEAVFTQVQQHLNDITQYYHANAQSKQTAAVFNAAIHWYQFYLRAFPDRTQTAGIHFLYAELLTVAGRHDIAAKEYERTAYNYASHDKAAEAGYAALLAYTKHESELTGELRKQWHEDGISSALKFAQTFPDHVQATPVLLRTAQQLFSAGDYNRAVQVANLLTAKKTITPQIRLEALTIIAHAEFERNNFAAAEPVYKKILSSPQLEDSKRSALEDKLAASIYKQGEQARQSGDLATTAIHFLRIATLVPSTTIAMTARYDAAVIYINNKDYKNAIGVLEAWQRDYPNQKLNKDIARKLATLYQDNGQTLKAAAQYELLARSETDPAIIREARWTAATLYEQTNKTDSTIRAWRMFISTYPIPAEQAIEAREKLVRIYERMGKTKEQRQWQQAIITADAEAGTGRTDRTRYLAAHAQIELSKTELATYQSIALREPLKENLVRKKQSLQKAVANYTKAANYGISDVTTTATYQIAEIYLDFGRALIDSERPRELNGEELEQYEILLEEQAYPFEEKAIAIHESNLQHIVTGTYDEAIQESLTRLAEMLPVRYAKTEGSEAFVTF